MSEVVEPFLIEAMRRSPTGHIRHNQGPGRGALGTSAAVFLRELDEYVEARVAAALAPIEADTDQPHEAASDE